MKRVIKFFYLFIVISCTIFQVQANSSVANSVVIDNNNRIVVAGFFYNGFTTDFLIIRYNSDGSLDTTFNPDGDIPGIVITPVTSDGNDEINDVVIDNNNKIVVTGVANVGFTSDFAVARYNEDGTLDTTFNPTGVIPGVVTTIVTDFENVANSLVIDNNNKIVVAGVANTGTFTNFALARYNQDGSLDTTFNSAGDLPGTVTTNIGGTTEANEFTVNGSDDGANSVTIDNNNKIVAAGFTSDLFINIALVRYNPDGSLDTTFNPDGILPSPLGPVGPRPGIVVTPVFNDSTANDVKIDNNNKIVIVGYTTPLPAATTVIETPLINAPTTNSDFVVVRYNNDGSLDTTLNPLTLTPAVGPVPGVVVTDIASFNDNAFSLAIDNNNKMVVAGLSGDGTSNRFTTARYNPNGTLDATFSSLPGNPDQATAIGARPGIVITDLFSNNFQINQTVGDSQGNAVVIDNNNRVVVTGFSNDSAQNNATTIRYDSSGILDVTFNPAILLEQLLVQPRGSRPGVVITEINLFDNTPQNILGYRDDTVRIADFARVSPSIVAQLVAAQEPFRVPVIALPPTGLITNDIQPIIRGIARPYDLVTIAINEVPLATTLADVTGNWSVILPHLIDGNYTLTALVTDSLSKLTLRSAALSLTIDTQAPEPPVIQFPIANSFINLRQPVIRGTAKASSAVALYINDALVSMANVDRTGVWSVPVTVTTDGKFELYALAADAAGNVSLPSTVTTFIVDTAPPRAPVIIAPTNNTISTRNALLVTGQAKPYVPVELLLNNKVIVRVSANGQGQWSYTAVLAPGTYSIIARVRDPIATTVLSSTPVTVTIASGATARQAGPSTAQERAAGGQAITGKAAPGSTVRLVIGSQAAVRVPVSPTGVWSYAPVLSPGRHRVNAYFTDVTGQQRLGSMTLAR